MNQAQTQDDFWNVAEGRNTKKRSFLDRLSSIGTELVSLFALPNDNTTEGASEIQSEKTLTTGLVNEPMPDCCSLYYNIDLHPERECPYEGSKSEYTCPEGFYQQYWTCVEGTRIAACAECTESQETCWEGDFHCSIWWWVGQEG